MKKIKFISIFCVSILIFSFFAFSVSASSSQDNVYVFDFSYSLDYSLYSGDGTTPLGTYSFTSSGNPENDVNNPDKFFGNRLCVFYSDFGTSNLTHFRIRLRGYKITEFFQQFNVRQENRLYFNFSNQRYYSAMFNNSDITIGFNNFQEGLPRFVTQKIQHQFDGYSYFENFIDVVLPDTFYDFTIDEITIDVKAKYGSFMSVQLEFAPMIVYSGNDVDKILNGLNDIFGDDYNTPNRKPLDDYNALENQLMQGADDNLKGFANDMNIVIPNILTEFRPTFLAVGNALNYIVTRIPYFNALLIISVTLGALGVLLGVFIAFGGREDKGNRSRKGKGD